jgi:hypothetical protein
MGAHAFGVPLPVGDMISSGVGIASNFVGGGGSQKRDMFTHRATADALWFRMLFNFFLSSRPASVTGAALSGLSSTS